MLTKDEFLLLLRDIFISSSIASSTEPELGYERLTVAGAFTIAGSQNRRCLPWVRTS